MQLPVCCFAILQQPQHLPFKRPQSIGQISVRPSDVVLMDAKEVFTLGHVLPTTHPDYHAILFADNQWPDAPEFRAAVEAYYAYAAPGNAAVAQHTGAVLITKPTPTDAAGK
jgi:hypothetical protein